MRRVAVAVFSLVLAALVQLIGWTHRPTEGKKASVELLIGVLSARHHHDQRQAIRDTWMGNIRQHPLFHKRVLVKFIVGQRGCLVPEEDREDQYSCSLLNLSTVPAQEVQLLGVSGHSLLIPSDVSKLSLHFTVMHPLVITQLAVFSNTAQGLVRGNVTEAVASAEFSAVSPGTRVGWMLYKPVEQFILPKGFEGTLVWEAQDSSELKTVNISAVKLNNGGGVLKLRPIEEGTLPYRNALGYPGLAGGFSFKVYHVESLVEHIHGRPARLRRRSAQLKQEDEALELENQTHGDLVFVDLLDTYRNIPSKLLKFYNWSISNVEFDLLLKTDDDCFIDVDAVLLKMESTQRIAHTRGLWWGNFRQNWAVDSVGKWQELNYASSVYPAFACGSGYVVSRALVQWLGTNAQILKPYQGEDVSMGIWMAAIAPRKYQDPGWLCEKECFSDMLSSPQYSPEELRSLWDNKSRCGDPCGCS
ncbi:hypothetical protein DNTS_026792 [Danionella cerebrum]|uniref:Hexosyltransferase n=1 Tax=Danionella cerebrum TaxID=2873325 RepID=A0A553NGH3_9TELE|nr:hypothetical protein DNTS_026792 [Danionella translucida]